MKRVRPVWRHVAGLRDDARPGNRRGAKSAGLEGGGRLHLARGARVQADALGLVGKAARP
jgi:hypothetical protein